MEAKVILYTLKEASCKGFSRIVLFSHTKKVIDSINGQADWAINSITLDIISQCSWFSFVSFYFISRALNEAAHALAKLCSKFSRIFCREDVV